MLRVNAPALPAQAQRQLRAWQREVTRAGAYAAQVAAAKRAFAQRNRGDCATFVEIKRALDATCPGVRRCHYCQDSCADELEHIRPKDLYPNEVFAWENYLFACGPCNGPKSNRYAVIRRKRLVEVSRPRGAAIRPPLRGTHALIDLRVEDPTRLLRLDLSGTFRFHAIPAPGTVDHLRATYTLKVLALNTRETLCRQRRIAFDGYLARLEQYVRIKGNGPKARARRDMLAASLRQVDHPTVWAEMKRQRGSYPQLARLFDAAPEALLW